MNRSFLFLLFLLPATLGFDTPQEAATCVCPEVSNLQKTGQTSSSISYSWDAQLPATRYRLWYTRQEDHFTSGNFFTTSASYTFSDLTTGHYTFYVVTICDEEASSIIGIEDMIQG